MTWKNDIHGLLFKSNELKLYRPSHTWGMKLSQLDRQPGTVRIVTFRLPGKVTDDYYATQIARRPSDMFVLIGSGGRTEEFSKAQELKARFLEVRIALHSELHVKAVASAPKTVYVGSANFGSSSWADLTLGVRSVDAHQYFVDKIFNPLWSEATEI